MIKQTHRRYNQDVGIKEIYEYYCHMYFKEKFIKVNGEASIKSKVHKDSKYNITSSQYNKIVKEFHQLIVKDILKGEDFILFERLGTIGVRKNKIKIKVDVNGVVQTNAPIDFKATNDLWDENPEAKEKKILIRHINHHTKKYIHRWYWDKGDANFRCKSAYSFIPSRTNKRLLATVLKDEDNEVDFYTRFNRQKKF